jgi:hypothetical protein
VSTATIRIGRINNWLKNGGSICPWARSAPLTFLIPGATDLQVCDLHEFAAQQVAGALVMVALDDTINDHDYLEVVCWARKAFLEILRSCTLASIPDIEERELKHAVQGVGKLLADPHATMRPYLALKERALYTICMAPMYPEGHPRWAPHAMLIATYVDDVAQAKRRSDAGVRAVRDQMTAATGAVYDANELVLPLPKEPA